jgi:UDP-3-O-[3-hydroxymyristoyl] glucosamine N-acyltransferase
VVVTLGEIADRIGAELVGDRAVTVTGLGSLASAEPGQLSHLSIPSYKKHLATTQATAVILAPGDAEECPCHALVVDAPKLAFAKASQLFARPDALAAGVDPSAVVDPSCTVDPTAAIGPNVVVGANTDIGPGVRIFANTVVGERCRLADDVTLMANVTLYSDVKIGARGIVHSHAVIGGDGFGFEPDATGRLHAVAQIGGVTIGDDVSIGAGTCIDCGAIDDTVVEDGVKIDNQVQVGHNTRIGAHSIICGKVGIVGSSVIGKHCVLAGGSGVGGDGPVELCDGVVVTVRTVITQSVDRPGVYSGTVLFSDHNRWRRNALRYHGLDDLFKRVRRLEQARGKATGDADEGGDNNQGSP